MVVAIILHITWDNIVNRPVPLGLLHTKKLLVASPKVKKQSDGHEPEILRAHTQLNRAVIQKPGKQLLVVYPATPFFDVGSSSLSTVRFVPLNIASVMAAL